MKRNFLFAALITLFAPNFLATAQENDGGDPLQTEEKFFEEGDVAAPPQSDESLDLMTEDPPEIPTDTADTGAEEESGSEPEEESEPEQEIDANGNVVENEESEEYDDPQDEPDEYDDTYVTEEEEDNSPPLTGVKSNIDMRKERQSGLKSSKAPRTYRGTKEGLDKYRDQKKIKHPLSKRGLYKITKERAYLYKLKESKQTNFSSVKFGFFDPKNLENKSTGTSFENIYDSNNNPLILFDYEWNAFKGGLGILTYKAGIGIFVATGNGQFDPASPNANLVPPENFTLVAFPLGVGAVYRAQFWDKQLLVPYLDGGVDLFGFTEIRDDDTGPKFGAAYMAHGAGGLAVNISGLDLMSMIELDRENGINDIYFNVEFRVYANLGGNFDFGGNYIGGGVSAAF